MPSSWSESNRLHATNQRIDAFENQIDEFYSNEAEALAIDDVIEDNYDDAFSRFDEPEDRYLDAAFEDRYYMPEADFDY
jgi:hypothetical protein